MGQLWFIFKGVSRADRGQFFRYGKGVFKPPEERRLDRLRTAAPGLWHLFELHSDWFEGKMVLDPRRLFSLDGRHLNEIQLQRRNHPMGRYPLEQPPDRRFLFARAS